VDLVKICNGKNILYTVSQSEHSNIVMRSWCRHNDQW